MQVLSPALAPPAFFPGRGGAENSAHKSFPGGWATAPADLTQGACPMPHSRSGGRGVSVFGAVLLRNGILMIVRYFSQGSVENQNQ